VHVLFLAGKGNLPPACTLQFVTAVTRPVGPPAASSGIAGARKRRFCLWISRISGTLRGNCQSGTSRMYLKWLAFSSAGCRHLNFPRCHSFPLRFRSGRIPSGHGPTLYVVGHGQGRRTLSQSCGVPDPSADRPPNPREEVRGQPASPLQEPPS
jgi:hypothetical protein